MQTTYFLELTDTFGNELNYSHVTRFKVNASSLRGAVSKVSRETGYKFRYNGSYYKAKNACMALVEFGEYMDTQEIENNYIIHVIL